MRQFNVALLNQFAVVRGVEALPYVAVEHLDPSVRLPRAFEESVHVARRNVVGTAEGNQPEVEKPDDHTDA